MRFLALLLLMTWTTGCATTQPHQQQSANNMKESPSSATSAGVKPVQDQRALADLKEMAAALSSAKSMSFNTISTTPIRGPNGQWIHVFSTAKVSMQRPNHLRIETGGDAFPQQIYYDGKTFSINAPEKKLYTQSEMTGSIDTVLAQASEKGGDAFPFADVLIADPYASWAQGLEGAVYVGESTRNNEKLTHLALTAKDVSWEVWTDQKTHLPRLVYVKYTTETHSPTVMIEFSKWKLNAKMPASTFTFKAPSGEKKIALKAPEGTQK
jgi:hypothetical protein